MFKNLIILTLISLLVGLCYSITTGVFCHCSFITCDSETKELKGYFA